TSIGRTLAPSILIDWIIYPEHHKPDSLHDAKFRRAWFFVWLALLGSSLAGAIYGVLPETSRREPLTLQSCLSALIGDLEGSTRQETDRMQSILRKVLLEKLTAEQAVQSIPLSKVGRLGLWFR